MFDFKRNSDNWINICTRDALFLSFVIYFSSLGKRIFISFFYRCIHICFASYYNYHKLLFFVPYKIFSWNCKNQSYCQFVS
ncbi:MAG: hypothetical protein MRECE_31c011 [Mycoplasmataceae bacterium CE_OT135]|nr:MAG: hypothetical protein MRECE_31c011 [Mycoplasmataceae bacterium CE_OT135]